MSSQLEHIPPSSPLPWHTGQRTIVTFSSCMVLNIHADVVMDSPYGRQALKRFCQEHGITIQHYHADKGIFTSNTWRQLCLQQEQGLAFAGVAVHHQNGIAERQIRELQEMACMMLIHAHHRWPNAITSNLWLYALRMATDAIIIIITQCL